MDIDIRPENWEVPLRGSRKAHEKLLCKFVEEVCCQFDLGEDYKTELVETANLMAKKEKHPPA